MLRRQRPLITRSTGVDGDHNLQESTTSRVRTFVLIATLAMTALATFVYWLVVASRGGVNWFEALTIPL